MLRGAAQMPGQGRERFDTPDYPAPAYPTRAFAEGIDDPLAEQMNAIAENWADKLGIERKHVLVMLHSGVTPSARWMR